MYHTIKISCLARIVAMILWLAMTLPTLAVVTFTGELSVSTNWLSGAQLGGVNFSTESIVIKGPGDDSLNQNRTSMDVITFIGPSGNGASSGTTIQFHWKLNAGNSLSTIVLFGIGGNNQVLATTSYGSRTFEGDFRVTLAQGDQFAFALDTRIYKGPAPTLTITPAQADIAVLKSGPTTILAGSNLVYTLKITNAGPSKAWNVVLSDNLPSGVTFVSASGGGSLSNNVVRWPVISCLTNGTATNFILEVTAPQNGVFTNRAYSTADTADPSPANNDGTDSRSQVITAVTGSGYNVSGFVYQDLNRNGFKDTVETGPGIALYVKLIPSASPSGPAQAAVAIDVNTGSYLLTNVVSGTYTIVVDDNNTLTDVSPTLPAGWTGVMPPNQTIAGAVVGSNDVQSQNFGIINAISISGVVFNDNGNGGGTANNGIRNGAEPGLSGVAIKLTGSGEATIYDTTVTDGNGNFTLYIPGSLTAGTQLRIVEMNLSSYRSVGASAGTTSGTYDRTSDVIAFNYSPGVSYTGIQFGDVKENMFTTDGQQSVLPGNVVFYTHAFTAGTAGQVTFTVASISSPSMTGWNETLYRDSNGNGQLDAGETVISGPITVAADEKVMLILKEFVPVTAPINARNQVTITAQFDYTGANPALVASYTRTDLTTVGSPTTAGLALTKSVDKATAAPGDTLTYTIAYVNNSSEILSNVIISDATPTYTRFASAGHGPLPANLSGITITKPAVGATGTIKWIFSGTLAPSANGTVTYQVTLE